MDDLILIKNQLLLISYAMMELKGERSKWKGGQNMDDVPKSFLEIYLGPQILKII